MASYLDLQNKLIEVSGVQNVYFQPPESMKLSYPAIVFTRSNIRNTFADNEVYTQSYMYEVTVIDKDPDSLIVKAVSKLPKIRHERTFKSDNLNHDLFTIYY